MDFLLLSIALLTIIWAGLGITLLLLPRRGRMQAIEWFGLAFPFGCAFVSLGSFGLGFVLTGAPFKWTLALACAAAGGIGLIVRRSSLSEMEWPGLTHWHEWLWLVILSLQMWIVALCCYHLRMGWDALLIWEFKARVAFFSGGGMPLDYFKGPVNIWPHSYYPLLLPLTEAWLYDWLRRPDQTLVKLLMPFFYLSALCQLYAAGKRFCAHSWQAGFAPCLLFLVPLAWVGEGSVSSGYADFPLAVGYLGAVIYLAEYRQTGENKLVWLIGLLAGMLVWIKHEGMILWLCLMLLAIIEVLRRRAFAQLAVLILPGALLLVGWKIFLRALDSPDYQVFVPITWATFRAGLRMVPEIAASEFTELLKWHEWGIL